VAPKSLLGGRLPVSGVTWNDAAAAVHAVGLVVNWSSAACPTDPAGPEPVVRTVPPAGASVALGTNIEFCNGASA